MDLLKSDNPYPDWVLLKLNLVSIISGQYDLNVTLKFQDNWQPLLDGRIKWGLKGGELKVSSKNCEILQNTNPYGSVVTETDTNNFTWILMPSITSSVNDGSLSFQIGTAIATSDSFEITVAFIPTLADISVIDAEGLWKHDISPNKHGVLERAIAQYIQQNYCSPHLSFIQLGSQTVPTTHPSIPVDPEPLATLIEQIYHHESDNLIELAEIASLNALEDFAGANLIATQLSGLSLGNANLFQTNFRGANLTDIDLSEADLSYSNLKGADLSGAYLGNANLSYADLQKASLALANLIGADLQNANLEEANLSNANLSGANLQDAKFGNNSGLTEDLQQLIKERGGQLE